MEAFGVLHLDQREDSTLVTFVGEIDRDLTDRLAEVRAALSQRTGPVLVDCSDVTFFGAFGVRALIELGAVGPGDAVLVATSPVVDLALEAAGLRESRRSEQGGGPVAR